MQIKLWWPILFVTMIITAAVIIFPSDLRLADLLGKAGKIDEAIQAYRELLAEEPGRDDIRLQLVKLHIRQRQFEEAIEQVGKISPDFITDSTMLHQMADIYSELGDRQRTVATFERLCQLAPDSRTYQIRLADAYEWNLQTAEALQLYEQLLSETPNAEPLLTSLVRLSVAAKNWVKAKLYLRRMLNQNPANAASRKLLGDIYVETNQKGLAIAQYEKARILARDDLELAERLAQLYLATGDETSAVALYEELFLQDPLKNSYLDQLVRLTEQTSPYKTIGYLNHRRTFETDDLDTSLKIYRLYLACTDLDGAISELRNVANRHPNQAKYRHQLALLYKQAQQPDKAAALFHHLLQFGDYREQAASELLAYYRDVGNDRKRVEVYVYLMQNDALDRPGRLEFANLLLLLGRYGPATEVFEGLLDDEPGDAGTRMQLAELYVLQNNGSKAIALLKQGREKYHAADEPYLLFTADLFERIDDLQESIRSWEYVVGLNPDRTYQMSLAALYLKAKAYKKAILAYNRLLKRSPRNIGLHLILADIEWRQQHLDEMHERIWELLSLAPPPRELQKHVGHFYFERGFYRTAAAHLDMASLHATTPDSLILQQRAVALARSNQPEKARKAFSSHFKYFPGDDYAHYQLGALLWYQGRRKAAKREMQLALELNKNRPESRQVLTTRAGVYAHLGARDQSVRIYRALLSRYPEGTTAMLDYAEGLLILKDYPECEKWLSRAASRQPDDPRTLRLQARFYSEIKDYKKAMAALDRLRLFTPGDPGLSLDLAEAHLLAGDWVAGMRTLRDAAADHPNDARVFRRIARLRREHSEAFAFAQHQYGHSGFLTRISRLSVTKAFSSLFGVEMSIGRTSRTTDHAGFVDHAYRNIGLGVHSVWGPHLETRFAAQARQRGDDLSFAGHGELSVHPVSAASMSLAADLNAIWSDPLMAAFFDGRMSRLRSDFNLTLVKNIVLWNRISAERHSVQSETFGQAWQISTQLGYRWGIKPHIVTYYELYHLTYHYERAANAAVIAIPEQESVHYLGAAIEHQLTKRFYFQVSSALGLSRHSGAPSFFGSMHLEYTLLRNLRLRANLRIGEKYLLASGDKQRTFGVDLFYFY